MILVSTPLLPQAALKSRFLVAAAVAAVEEPLFSSFSSSSIFVNFLGTVMLILVVSSNTAARPVFLGLQKDDPKLFFWWAGILLSAFTALFFSTNCGCLADFSAGCC